MYDHVHSFFLDASPLEEPGDGHTRPVVGVDEVGVDADVLRRLAHADAAHLLRHHRQPAEL